MPVLNDKTTIPLFVVIASVPFLIGGILWLTSMDAKAQKALDQNALSKEITSDLGKKVDDIQKSVHRIEVKLGTYPKNKGE